MKRGDVVTAVVPGDYGKPRPALILQSDRFADVDSVILCPFTTTVISTPLFRLLVEPSETNGLTARSMLMVDKVTALRRNRVGAIIGHVDPTVTAEAGRLVMLLLDLS